MKRYLALIGCCVTAFAQTPLPHAGYRFPEPLEVAPGQIVMITLAGMGTSGATSSFVSVPETELAGYRATITQPGFSPVVVRFLGIQPRPCPQGQPNCATTATSFTLMMPLEMNAGDEAVLVLNDRGRDLTPIPLRILPDKIHILNTCDEAAVFIGVAAEANGSCLPVVQHRNGRLVTRENPARPGEYLSAWAYGLGMPGRRVPDPNAEPSNVLHPPELRFGYRSTLLGITQLSGPAARPAFAGELGGTGRYLINFEVPAVPEGVNLPLCDESVKTNFSVLVRGQASSDTIRLCLQP